jgi:hypothetical protein
LQAIVGKVVWHILDNARRLGPLKRVSRGAYQVRTLARMIDEGVVAAA